MEGGTGAATALTIAAGQVVKITSAAGVDEYVTIAVADTDDPDTGGAGAVQTLTLAAPLQYNHAAADVITASTDLCDAENQIDLRAIATDDISSSGEVYTVKLDIAGAAADDSITVGLDINSSIGAQQDDICWMDNGTDGTNDRNTFCWIDLGEDKSTTLIENRLSK